MGVSLGDRLGAVFPVGIDETIAQPVGRAGGIVLHPAVNAIFLPCDPTQQRIGEAGEALGTWITAHRFDTQIHRGTVRHIEK